MNFRGCKMGSDILTSGAGLDCEHEIRRLRAELDDAWWHEAPLERILELESRLENCRTRLRGDAQQRAGRLRK
jgi:hypothetical protein